MKIGLMALAILAAVALSAPARADFDCQAPVDTASGQVQGSAMDEGEACVWKGIPFAAPPVGNKRWQAPAPAPAWSGVRPADKFGARCMQQGIMAAENLTAENGMSEDCLFVNVWRPKKSGVFPVMVWVHGGGYYGGSGDSEWYWGDRLAQAGDLVVVSINYRLNIFGFFYLPGLKAEDPHGSVGSYGTLDQVAALQWVHDNIQNFGGDPGNVTIFGESAGGWSICTLIATPLAKGLIHRAILESGGCTRALDLDKGYEFGNQTAETFGCDPNDLACLRAIDPKKLMKKMVGNMGRVGSVFMPGQDGYVLTGTPLSMIQQGDYNHVPFMAGSNRDEFAKAMKLNRKLKKTPPEMYKDVLMTRFHMTGDEAERLMGMYPLSEFDNRPIEAYGRMFGADLSLACPTYDGLLAASGHQDEVYYYRFDFDDTRYGKYLGAAHALEIPFIFDAFDRLPAKALYGKKHVEAARPLQKIIQGYWINFAHHGDPNGAGLPDWPRFDPSNQKMQVFDTVVRTEPVDITPRCEFWSEWSQGPHSSMEQLFK